MTNEENSCPGISSQMAGKADACKGCPNASYCQEGVKIDENVMLIKKNLSSVKKIIAVMSGKGGVGKSTLTKAIGVYLSTNKIKTLIMDFDLTGPSIPRLTKTEQKVVYEHQDKIYPVEINETLHCISVGHFIKFNINIFDSTYKTNLIKHILLKVDFDYDIVLIDTPPGISDEHLSLVNYINLFGLILITTPQRISFGDVKRQIDFARKTNLKIFGVIENMKDFICPCCGHVNVIFNDCDVKKYCLENKIKYYGAINVKQEISKACDSGNDFESQLLEHVINDIITYL